jgi:hypothetical protein
MNDEKRRVNAYVTNELYTRVIRSGYGITDAIIQGLECLMSHHGGIKTPDNEDNSGIAGRTHKRATRSDK